MVVGVGLLTGCVVEIVPLALNHPGNPAAPESPPGEVAAGPAEPDGPPPADEGTGRSVDARAQDDSVPGEGPAPDDGMADPSGGAMSHGAEEGAQATTKERGQGAADDPAGHSVPNSEDGVAAQGHEQPASGEPANGTHGQGSKPPQEQQRDGHADPGEAPSPGSGAREREKTPFPLLQRALPGLASMRDVHPLVVHFPIALWSAALLFWIIGMMRTQETWLATARGLTLLALLGAAASVGTGLLAERGLGHDSSGHDLVHAHKYFMIATTALGALTTLVAYLTRKRGRRWGWAWGSCLIVTVAVMTLGADRGGLLVYGHGVGTATREEASGQAQARMRVMMGARARHRRTATPHRGVSAGVRIQSPRRNPPLSVAGVSRGRDGDA